MIECKECKTELIKSNKGMKCPNWFNCSKHDIETDDSIIAYLKAENAELKATLSVIREKISDATYHGKASFSACLSYIDVLAKDKLEQANKQERRDEL